MWICRAKNGASDVRTVVRFTRSHATLKSQYDALVIGGGGSCLEFAIIANVKNFKFYSLHFRRLEIHFYATWLDIVPGARVVIIFIFPKNNTVKCSFFEGHNGLVAVSLKACTISSEFEHSSSDGVGVRLCRPPTSREED